MQTMQQDLDRGGQTMSIQNCPTCNKEVPAEWGQYSYCSYECAMAYEKKTIKPISFTPDQKRELWEKDSKIQQVCKNCTFLGSDGAGDDYCSNEWPICMRFQ